MTAFTNVGQGKKGCLRVSLSRKIIPLDLYELGGRSFVKKTLFVRRPWRKHWYRISAQAGHRAFGGEGFIMQKLEGDGMPLFMPADMCFRRYSLPAKHCGLIRAAW